MPTCVGRISFLIRAGCESRDAAYELAATHPACTVRLHVLFQFPIGYSRRSSRGTAGLKPLRYGESSTVHKKSRFRVTPRSPRPVYLGLTWAGSIPGLNLGWLLSAPLRSSGCVQPPGRRGYCYCGYGVCKYLRPAATSIGFQAAISSSSGPCLLLQSSSHH